MFKKDLTARLERIFGMKKVSFNAPSESYEQDTIFINVAECISRPAKAKMLIQVTGFIQIFAQHENLPFGFMARKLEAAKLADVKDLFFFQVDAEVTNSQARLLNLSERQAKFVFLFSTQYDPNKGKLTSVTFEEDLS